MGEDLYALSRHCEERSDAAIQGVRVPTLAAFVPCARQGHGLPRRLRRLAMTTKGAGPGGEKRAKGEPRPAPPRKNQLAVTPAAWSCTSS
jgi:hypothetical protein